MQGEMWGASTEGNEAAHVSYTGEPDLTMQAMSHSPLPGTEVNPGCLEQQKPSLMEDTLVHRLSRRLLRQILGHISCQTAKITTTIP